MIHRTSEAERAIDKWGELVQACVQASSTRVRQQDRTSAWQKVGLWQAAAYTRSAHTLSTRP